jgi:hypothetical protein
MSIVQANVPPTLLSRQGRELARIGQATEIAVARTIAIAEVETAKLDALDQIAARALQGVGLVSQLEQQFSQIVPIAATRLQAVGDMHALASAGVVAQAPRRLSCGR